MEEAQRGVVRPVEVLEEQRLGADRVDRDVLSAMNVYAYAGAGRARDKPDERRDRRR